MEEKKFDYIRFSGDYDEVGMYKRIAIEHGFDYWKFVNVMARKDKRYSNKIVHGLSDYIPFTED